jgi:asparagine synthase (glutamine-hydrolysing)
MAVIQAMFTHHTAEAYEPKDFSIKTRRVVVSEVNEWRSHDEIVLDWGDPTWAISSEALALSCRNNQARSLFGRSWLYYHRPTHRLIIGVDRLGLFPVLVQRGDNKTYVASDALALTQLPGIGGEINSSALLESLAYGQLIGETASLEQTEYLQAGALLTVESCGTYHLQNSLPFYLPHETQGNEQDAIDSLVAAVGERLYQDPDTLLPLSGGLDSRLLLAAAHAAGFRPATFSFAPPGSLDYQIAQNMATAIGAKFYTPEESTRQFTQLQHNIARLSGGEVPIAQGFALLNPDLLTRTRGRNILTTTGAKTFRGIYYDRGLAGSELLGAAGLKKVSLKNARRYAEDVFNHSLRPFTQAWPSLREAFYERLHLRLDTYESQALDAEHYLDAIYLGEHVRRLEVAMQQLLSRDYARSHPFMDAEVIEQMSALPLSQRLGGRFQRRAISKLSPQLAEVNWDKTMRPLAESVRWEERYMGLAGYLGIMPQADENTMMCDSELQSWLNRNSEQTGYLWHALQQADVPEWEIASGIQNLLNSPQRLPALSALSSFNAWGDYLHQHKASLAA